MSRKDEIKQQISDFLAATKTTRREMLTYGIEVEYQADGDGGIDWDADAEYIYDMDAMHADEDEQAQDIIQDDPLEYIYQDMLSPYIKSRLTNGCYNTFDLRPLYRIIRNTVDTDRVCLADIEEHWEELACLFRLKDFVDFEQEIRSNAFGTVDIDWHDYLRDDAPRLVDIETNYDRCDDQSVSGGEIRTNGGLSYDDILNATADILGDITAANGCYIDKDCSFHVHVQLGDLYHVYGKGKLLRYIMQYIALNFDRLPESVRSRLADGGNRWIRPTCDDNKYRWIHVHHQGTIEFRLFGNVSNFEDGQTCINFVSDALAYAYKGVRRKLPLVSDTTIGYTLRYGPQELLYALKALSACNHNQEVA